ncbi:MAG: hypothetical protein Q4E51_01645 [Lachnospiraceae bacterium]|nr:hypothetical protein [Lachnospiraceae bacterium]
MAKEKVDKAQMRINEENLQHKGAWLTKEVCEEYRKMAEDINKTDCQDIDKHKELRLELQNKYGLTQIEAINILNGNNIADYVNKYTRVRNRIPITKK